MASSTLSTKTGGTHVRMVDLIATKRDGKEHSRAEIDFIISGVMDGSVPDYQLSAWLMAVCWRGLTDEETAFYTDALCRSGEVLDLSAIGSVVGDKHSTGGVGDKTTLVFVPMLSAAGIPMAKLSGRGLGHTGGTLDKLESIPGFNVSLSIEAFTRQVKEIGMAIGGQTQELAPADGKIYALRDVTGTVEPISLIAGSVVAKKIAAGANIIILDVKSGKGSLVGSVEQAQELARLMGEVGERLKRPVLAVVTDMEQPLGFAVGHTVEVIEAIETLKGNAPADLKELCLSLGSLALVRSGKAADKDAARKILEDVLTSGKALEKFRTLIKAQGGDASVIENYDLMPKAKHQFEYMPKASAPCWVEHLDGHKVAEACKLMGAGRAKKGDPINLGVGVVLKAKVGSKVEAGQPVAIVHADNQEHFDLASKKLDEAFKYSKEPVPVPAIIKAMPKH